MPLQTIYALSGSNITVSGGGQLSGITQGDGSHLNGRTITLNSNAWEGIVVDDDDANFADNDTGQRLEGAQTFGGTLYADNLIVEAEFSIVVADSLGNQYTLYAFNINQPGTGLPAFGTVEGLAFRENTSGTGAFPPIGQPLTVISTGEGPSTPYTTLATPPCFTPGTLIATPSGLRDVADLRRGDDVVTLDHGAQPIRWIGRADLPRAVIDREDRFRPVEITPHCFGQGAPFQRLIVSPQHRVFVSGWRAQLYCGQDEVLVTAAQLCNGHSIQRQRDATDVTYIHLLFDRHEILLSNGLPTESYFPGAVETTLMAGEIRALFPHALGPAVARLTARPCVQDRSARLLTV